VRGHQHAAQVLEGGDQVGGVGVAPVQAQLARHLRRQQRAQEVLARLARARAVGLAVQQGQAGRQLLDGGEAQQPHGTVQAGVVAGVGTGKNDRIAQTQQAGAEAGVVGHGVDQVLHPRGVAPRGALHLARGPLQAGQVGLPVQVRHQACQRGFGLVAQGVGVGAHGACFSRGRRALNDIYETQMLSMKT
jgi:hypothetical protein